MASKKEGNANVENLTEAIKYLNTPNAVNKGSSLHDHLINVFIRLLEQKPENALEQFETISSELKKESIQLRDDEIPSVKELPIDFTDKNLNTRRSSLFHAGLDGEDDLEETGGMINVGDMTNLIEEAEVLQWIGVGVGREETFRLMLAMKKLIEKNPLSTIRFWGKILGVNGDYFIAEGEYKEGEGLADYEEEEEEEQKQTTDDFDDTTEESEIEERHLKEEQANESAQRKIIPKEVLSGTNRYVYWVCQNAGDAWIKLPPVTAAQISASRLITKFFTGDLNAEVKSYPAFPGKEINLLRAVICRITANTMISPKGYFIMEEGGENEEDEESLMSADPDYEPLPIRDLLNLRNWVHHHPYILPQGRCVYYHVPKEPKDGEFSDEEEEEEEEERPASEWGPTLLTSISEDDAIGGIEPWSPRVTSELMGGYAMPYVRSNRWPGAYGLAYQSRFTNVYVGYGIKYIGEQYSPPLPPSILPEFDDSEHVEAVEVSLEEELEFQAALKKEQEDLLGEQEEGEEEYEEEEEEYEEDEDDT